MRIGPAPGVQSQTRIRALHRCASPHPRPARPPRPLPGKRPARSLHIRSSAHDAARAWGITAPVAACTHPTRCPSRLAPVPRCATGAAARVHQVHGSCARSARLSARAHACRRAACSDRGTCLAERPRTLFCPRALVRTSCAAMYITIIASTRVLGQHCNKRFACAVDMPAWAAGPAGAGDTYEGLAWEGAGDGVLPHGNVHGAGCKACRGLLGREPSRGAGGAQLELLERHAGRPCAPPSSTRRAAGMGGARPDRANRRPVGSHPALGSCAFPPPL